MNCEVNVMGKKENSNEEKNIRAKENNLEAQRLQEDKLHQVAGGKHVDIKELTKTAYQILTH